MASYVFNPFTGALTPAGGAGDVTLTGTQTLTNKTLTSPVLGGITTTASGNAVIKPATNILEVQGDATSVVGKIQLNCHVNTHGQKIASQPHAQAATNTLTLPGGTTIGNGDAVLVSDVGTQTLTNKTIASPTITGDVTINAQGDLRLADADSSHYIALQAPATITTSVTLTLPAADGTNGQVLTTNGTGTLSFTTAAGGGGDIISEGNTSAEVIDTGSDGRFVVTTEGSERARIDSSGRLLVGTSSARSNINHRGTTGINPNVQFETATGSYNGGLSIINNSNAGYAAALTLGVSHGTSIGSNTIGTTGSQTGTISFSSSDGTNFIDCAQVRAEIDGTPGANDMPGRLVFSTTADGAASPTERMRITSDGSININTTTTIQGAKLTIQGIGASSGSGIPLAINDTTSGASGESYSITFNRNGSPVGSVTTTSSTTAFNTTSDYRLKENLIAVPDAITRFQQLKPSRFNFKIDPDRTIDGFLAHEVQSVVPEAITGKKDAVDADGNPVYQGIDQSKLVPLLTAALQEAIAKIESLEARLTAAGL